MLVWSLYGPSKRHRIISGLQTGLQTGCFADRGFGDDLQVSEPGPARNLESSQCLQLLTYPDGVLAG